MRKVRVPAVVNHEIWCMRRRLNRRGHRTGRTLVLKPTGQTGFWREGEFSVQAYVRCNLCGQEYPVARGPLSTCRGHR